MFSSGGLPYCTLYRVLLSSLLAVNRSYRIPSYMLQSRPLTVSPVSRVRLVARSMTRTEVVFVIVRVVPSKH